MTSQERLRTLVGKDIVGSQPLPNDVSAAMYEAADRLDQLEAIIKAVVWATDSMRALQPAGFSQESHLQQVKAYDGAMTLASAALAQPAKEEK